MMTKNKTIYITTPIYYVNAEPHIGTAYTTLAADTLARHYRNELGPENVRFLTGTDENSQKTVEAAKKKELSVEKYLEMMADGYKKCWKSLGIAYDDFMRTTSVRHLQGVEDFLKTMAQKSPQDVYKGEYSGPYCYKCETFLKPDELVDGKCPDHGIIPQDLQEENYFFRLSAYSDFLEQELTQNKLLPAKRKNEMLAFLKKGLEDISVTRETAEIGIPYAKDPAHKLYVWVEAVMNYYTALETNDLKAKFWPNTVHLVGKDITRFHSLIWPALLRSAGLPTPKKVLGHGFFTVNGQKMSKSLGNAIHPVTLVEKYGRDAVRMGLLTAFEFGNDGDFSLENFEKQINAKLAGGLGNLFYRTVHLAQKMLGGQKNDEKDVKKTQKEKIEALLTPFKEVLALFDAQNPENDQKTPKIKRAYEILFETVDAANVLLNEREPWKKKDDLAFVRETFEAILPFLYAIYEMSTVLLPEKAPLMQQMLGNDEKWGEKVMLYDKVS